MGSGQTMPGSLMTCVNFARCSSHSMTNGLQAGGKLCRQKVTSLTDFANFDMVVNCGGLRGGQLFGDDKVIPVRCTHPLMLLTWSLPMFVQYVQDEHDICSSVWILHMMCTSQVS